MKERLLKILSDKCLTQCLIQELKLTDDIEQAIWYTLREVDFDRAVKIPPDDFTH